MASLDKAPFKACTRSSAPRLPIDAVAELDPSPLPSALPGLQTACDETGAPVEVKTPPAGLQVTKVGSLVLWPALAERNGVAPADEATIRPSTAIAALERIRTC